MRIESTVLMTAALLAPFASTCPTSFVDPGTTAGDFGDCRRLSLDRYCGRCRQADPVTMQSRQLLSCLDMASQSPRMRTGEVNIAPIIIFVDEFCAFHNYIHSGPAGVPSGPTIRSLFKDPSTGPSGRLCIRLLFLQELWLGQASIHLEGRQESSDACGKASKLVATLAESTVACQTVYLTAT